MCGTGERCGVVWSVHLLMWWLQVAFWQDSEWDSRQIVSFHSLDSVSSLRLCHKSTISQNHHVVHRYIAPYVLRVALVSVSALFGTR